MHRITLLVLIITEMLLCTPVVIVPGLYIPDSNFST